ncbi:disease resistance-like protein DSC1 [Senna tora]|uniref:Disease resistance-like protein DSC1 n=1 Tax=Senna tora TaxID=362788 RepID=A0A834T209_9FABA|nr:disease resistance-like protein DSC1 [Senna tora]
MKALYLERTSINELPPAMGCMLKLESDSKPVYVRNYTLDHVCLWCHETFSSKILGRIKESKASSNLTILLKLDFDCDPLEIKEYGVCPTYACEYQNFIKETLPPKQESKDLIFPALPTATWKTKTQGLKDIIYP